MFNRKKKKIKELIDTISHIEDVIRQYLYTVDSDYAYPSRFITLSVKLKFRTETEKLKQEQKLREEEIRLRVAEEVEKILKGTPIKESGCKYHSSPEAAE